MFTSRDYILRQIHVLAQALATVIGKRDRLSLAELERVMSDAIERVAGVDLDALRRMSHDELHRVLTGDGEVNGDINGVSDREINGGSDGEINGELAVALADLLAADENPDSRERAAWLYESAIEAGGAVPFDIADRLARLRAPGDGE